jgi:hypothetical protein
MLPQQILTIGLLMKSTFSNMAPGVACGYRRSATIPLFGTIRPEKASDTLGQYDHVMGNVYINEKAIHSMLNPI